MLLLTEDAAAAAAAAPAPAALAAAAAAESPAALAALQTPSDVVIHIDHSLNQGDLSVLQVANESGDFRKMLFCKVVEHKGDQNACTNLAAAVASLAAEDAAAAADEALGPPASQIMPFRGSINRHFCQTTG